MVHSPKHDSQINKNMFWLSCNNLTSNKITATMLVGYDVVQLPKYIFASQVG